MTNSQSTMLEMKQSPSFAITDFKRQFDEILAQKEIESSLKERQERLVVTLNAQI